MSNFLSATELQRRAAAVELLILDVDGVLTDGRLLFSGDLDLKAFHTLDGHGIKLLQRAGVQVAIISGRSSPAVRRRASDLGIKLLVEGREDKWTALQELLHDQPIAPAAIACMGDDWPDLAIMTRVGLALTVPGAHREVIARAHWQSTAAAGAGAVREACDLVLQAKGLYDAALAQYLTTQR